MAYRMLMAVLPAFFVIVVMLGRAGQILLAFKIFVVGWGSFCLIMVILTRTSSYFDNVVMAMAFFVPTICFWALIKNRKE